MKILFIHHLADLYGASRSLVRLSAGLIRRGHAVSCVLPEEGPLCDRLRIAGASVHVLPSLPVLHRSRLRGPRSVIGLLRDIRAARRFLRELLQQARPDIVHTNTAVILPVAGCEARRLGIPHVQHLRETFEDFGPLWRWYRGHLLRHADCVVCISAHLAAQFPARARARVRVLWNGLPREEFDSLPAEAATAFRRQYGCTDSVPVIALVGRIKLRRKGQDTFVQAAALLKDRHPEARWLIAGEPFAGNEHHLVELQALIRSLGLTDRVVLTGHLDDTRPALAACDISVMASGTPEPLGNVTIESMALGKAVVGTALGGTRELIEHGRTGLLVPPNDPAAMASAIDQLLADATQRDALGRAARVYYLQRLEFEVFCDQLEDTYRGLGAGAEGLTRAAGRT